MSCTRFRLAACSVVYFRFRNSRKLDRNGRKPCNFQNIWKPDKYTAGLFVAFLRIKNTLLFTFATMVQQSDFDGNTSHDSTQANEDFDVATASDGQFENEVQYIEITVIDNPLNIDRYFNRHYLLKRSLLSITLFICSKNKR